MPFSYYTFPAIKGLQANDEYFVCMIPLSLLSELFPYPVDTVAPEYRAQRCLNLNRIPEIREYILQNRDTYTFSALCASFSGPYEFLSVGESKTLGQLRISTDARFLLNDGQHRRSALLEALAVDPSLKQETISVVLFIDKGLKRSQQMFTDLNKHAVITTKSLNALYDSKDELAIMSRNIMNAIPLFRCYMDKEKDVLGKYSSNLFTLNNLVKANAKLVQGRKIDETVSRFAEEYWDAVINNITELKAVQNQKLTKSALRERYIITQGVTFLALGMLGNCFLLNPHLDMHVTLSRLSQIHWDRTNRCNWSGIAINDAGRIVKSAQSVKLTYLRIKELIGLSLSIQEKSELRKAKRHGTDHHG